MSGPAADPRGKGLDGTGRKVEDNAIMDAWFRLTKTGGGNILDNNGKQKANVLRTADIQKTTFSYFLNEYYNEVEGDGLKPGDLEAAFKNLDQKLEPKSYKPITPELL